MSASDVPRSKRARRSSYLATTPAYNNSVTLPRTPNGSAFSCRGRMIIRGAKRRAKRLYAVSCNALLASLFARNYL
jgi:hypothetical protein